MATCNTGQGINSCDYNKYNEGRRLILLFNNEERSGSKLPQYNRLPHALLELSFIKKQNGPAVSNLSPLPVAPVLQHSKKDNIITSKKV
jgi:hypothetical protein